ncbi:hypothetical protein JW911_00360 [Candidatus Peregrinibacteria bacterium]|nr:hypothetical protein [Candidatus Peregrinibacteria bacterium]
MKKYIVLLVCVLGVSLFFSGCGDNPNAEASEKDYTNLAKCLTEKGAKMYGAVTCSHCNNQKKAFGEAFKYIKYYECDPRTNLEDAKQCIEDGIQAYPTWRFSDGSEVLGAHTPEALGLRVGCEMPGEKSV